MVNSVTRQRIKFQIDAFVVCALPSPKQKCNRCLIKTIKGHHDRKQSSNIKLSSFVVAFLGRKSLNKSKRLIIDHIMEEFPNSIKPYKLPLSHEYQTNVDHTVFFRRCGSHTTMLYVNVDNMIITGDDESKISQLKTRLVKEFEVKDLGQLRYFLGIEITHGTERVVLSQRKYVLNLLTKTRMLGPRIVVALIEQKAKINAEEGEIVDKEVPEVGRSLDLSESHSGNIFCYEHVGLLYA
ncbi:hypothetical protein KSP39_PZI013160 [Platanthera zijinensis]|uniref:Reverse transcriptase Ty1/copia-type domain-containing protein n=1 Tax=Platanthera zijinensis TaxID=2320716 RepID=A0AAP0BD57_9ASPA